MHPKRGLLLNKYTAVAAMKLAIGPSTTSMGLIKA